MKEAFQKYKANFTKYFVYIILILVINFIASRLITEALMELRFGYGDNFKLILGVGLMIIGILQTFAITYGLLIAKKITKGEEVKQKEIFSEVFRYYFKILGIGVVLAIILIIIFLISRNYVYNNPGSIYMVLGIFLLVFSIFSMIFFPVYPYLVYHNEKIWNSIKLGMKIGGKYLFKIFGFALILGVILLITEILPDSIITFVFNGIIIGLLNMYLYLYVNNLMKIEEEIEEEIL